MQFTTNNDLIRSVFINIDNIPVLNIGQKAGRTDYIDFIKAEDMEYPIMKGVDIFNRSFISVKFSIRENDKITNSVTTFFQRYTDRDNYWVRGTAYFDIAFNTPVVLDEVFSSRMKKLLSGQVLKSIYAGFSSTDEEMIHGNGNEDIYIDMPKNNLLEDRLTDEFIVYI